MAERENEKANARLSPVRLSWTRVATSQCRAYSATSEGHSANKSLLSAKALTALTTVATVAAFWSQLPAAKQVECEAPASKKKEDKKASKTAEADQKRKLDGLTENSPMRLRMEAFNKRLQAEITTRIEQLDGQGKFQMDQWNRAEGGDGISMVMQDGQVFEKA
ncbi:Coproporphyrinogen-III oxidase, partial [Modicella reniformis]